MCQPMPCSIPEKRKSNIKIAQHLITQSNVKVHAVLLKYKLTEMNDYKCYFLNAENNTWLQLGFI
jgi:hypothetical protein